MLSTMFSEMSGKIPSNKSSRPLGRIFAGAVVTLLMVPALADEALPDSNGGRYTFSKVADGMLRLDTQTGEVALCSARTVGWACLVAAEDRVALENEIARLRSENAALKQDILSRGLPLPPGAMPEPPAAHDNDITIRLPDNADLDRAVSYVGQMWQRFVDAVVRAQKQMLNKS
jgi:hypothetical protein